MPAEGGRLSQSEREFTQPAVGDALAGSSEGISMGLPFGTAYRSVDSTPNCLVMSGRVVGLGALFGAHDLYASGRCRLFCGRACCSPPCDFSV